MAEKKSDIGSKKLVSLVPESWASWLTNCPNIKVEELLDSNLQWVGRENDSLMKVSTPELGLFLLLVELQLRYHRKMPLRVRAYTALAGEKYELPVYPVLINILPHVKDPQIPSCYESEFNEIRALQEYRVINLWEVDVNLVFEQNIRSLLPFVPILKGGGEEQVVRRALRELRADEELSQLESLLSFFSTFVLELPVVQQIMRWDMAVLRESPLAQELFREGRVDGQLELVLRQLTRRVGTLDESLVQRVRGLSSEELEGLAEALLDFSDVSDLQGWLANLTA
ncbi:DUF4351 domain-containing protein [Sodalinema gerasimenkoae]|uniref:DUF4351 domain-containing protein n=1 Tax=Sodalinema gerasimenkoae TaxID=2862348 RepID=UPI00135AB4A5|nr:DUF4351 domain-containing protein [Sodalinema gerasimenkoae]